RCDAPHLGDQMLEACGRHAVMRFVHRRVRIQARVGHNAVDEIIDHCGDVIDSTDPLIKAGLRLLLVDMGVSYPCLVFFGNERFVAAKREQAQPPRHLEQELETFSRNGRDWDKHKPPRRTEPHTAGEALASPCGKGMRFCPAYLFLSTSSGPSSKRRV